jgi:hypothetical protein
MTETLKDEDQQIVKEADEPVFVPDKLRAPALRTPSLRSQYRAV